MKRIILAAVASAILLAPSALAEDRAPDAAATQQRPHREILVRGVAVAVSPISVRASIGSIVTCAVRNRALVADLEVGDRVLMKCVAVNGRLVLRRLVIHPAPERREPTREREVRPALPAPATPVAPVPSRDVRAPGS